MFEKTDDAASFLVAVNVRNKEAEMALPEAWHGVNAVNMSTSEAVLLNNPFRLQPFEYKILKKE